MSACGCHYSEFVIPSLTRKLSIVTTVLTVSAKELCLGNFRNSWSEFFPCDTMLAHFVLWPGVHPSITSWSSIKWMNEWIKLVSGTAAALGLSYSVLEGNFDLQKQLCNVLLCHHCTARHRFCQLSLIPGLSQ